MDSCKRKICHILSFIAICIQFQIATATNIDCGGKPFHCVNSTHFNICVDLGAGISKTVDDFVIQCPPTTVCRGSSNFECEYQVPPTTTIRPSDETKYYKTNFHVTTTLGKIATTPVPRLDEINVKGLYKEHFNAIGVTTQKDYMADVQTQGQSTNSELVEISTGADVPASTNDIKLNNTKANVADITITSSKSNILKSSDSLGLFHLPPKDHLLQHDVELPSPTKLDGITFEHSVKPNTVSDVTKYTNILHNSNPSFTELPTNVLFDTNTESASQDSSTYHTQLMNTTPTISDSTNSFASVVTLNLNEIITAATQTENSNFVTKEKSLSQSFTTMRTVPGGESLESLLVADYRERSYTANSVTNNKDIMQSLTLDELPVSSDAHFVKSTHTMSDSTTIIDSPSLNTQDNNSDNFRGTPTSLSTPSYSSGNATTVGSLHEVSTDATQMESSYILTSGKPIFHNFTSTMPTTVSEGDSLRLLQFRNYSRSNVANITNDVTNNIHKSQEIAFKVLSVDSGVFPVEKMHTTLPDISREATITESSIVNAQDFIHFDNFRDTTTSLYFSTNTTTTVSLNEDSVGATQVDTITNRKAISDGSTTMQATLFHDDSLGLLQLPNHSEPSYVANITNDINKSQDIVFNKLPENNGVSLMNTTHDIFYDRTADATDTDTPISNSSYLSNTATTFGSLYEVDTKATQMKGTVTTEKPISLNYTSMMQTIKSESDSLGLLEMLNYSERSYAANIPNHKHKSQELVFKELPVHSGAPFEEQTLTIVLNTSTEATTSDSSIMNESDFIYFDNFKDNTTSMPTFMYLPTIKATMDTLNEKSVVATHSDTVIKKEAMSESSTTMQTTFTVGGSLGLLQLPSYSEHSHTTNNINDINKSQDIGFNILNVNNGDSFEKTRHTILHDKSRKVIDNDTSISTSSYLSTSANILDALHKINTEDTQIESTVTRRKPIAQSFTTMMQTIGSEADSRGLLQVNTSMDLNSESTQTEKISLMSPDIIWNVTTGTTNKDLSTLNDQYITISPSSYLFNNVTKIDYVNEENTAMELTTEPMQKESWDIVRSLKSSSRNLVSMKANVHDETMKKKSRLHGTTMTENLRKPSELNLTVQEIQEYITERSFISTNSKTIPTTTQELNIIDMTPPETIFINNTYFHRAFDNISAIDSDNFTNITPIINFKSSIISIYDVTSINDALENSTASNINFKENKLVTSQYIGTEEMSNVGTLSTEIDKYTKAQKMQNVVNSTASTVSLVFQNKTDVVLPLNIEDSNFKKSTRGYSSSYDYFLHIPSFRKSINNYTNGEIKQELSIKTTEIPYTQISTAQIEESENITSSGINSSISSSTSIPYLSNNERSINLKQTMSATAVGVSNFNAIKIENQFDKTQALDSPTVALNTNDTEVWFEDHVSTAKMKWLDFRTEQPIPAVISSAPIKSYSNQLTTEPVEKNYVNGDRSQITPVGSLAFFNVNTDVDNTGISKNRINTKNILANESQSPEILPRKRVDIVQSTVDLSEMSNNSKEIVNTDLTNGSHIVSILKDTGKRALNTETPIRFNDMLELNTRYSSGAKDIKENILSDVLDASSTTNVYFERNNSSKGEYRYGIDIKQEKPNNYINKSGAPESKLIDNMERRNKVASTHYGELFSSSNAKISENTYTLKDEIRQSSSQMPGYIFQDIRSNKNVMNSFHKSMNQYTPVTNPIGQILPKSTLREFTVPMNTMSHNKSIIIINNITSDTIFNDTDKKLPGKPLGESYKMTNNIATTATPSTNHRINPYIQGFIKSTDSKMSVTDNYKDTVHIRDLHLLENVESVKTATSFLLPARKADSTDKLNKNIQNASVKLTANEQSQTPEQDDLKLDTHFAQKTSKNGISTPSPISPAESFTKELVEHRLSVPVSLQMVKHVSRFTTMKPILIADSFDTNLKLGAKTIESRNDEKLYVKPTKLTVTHNTKRRNDWLLRRDNHTKIFRDVPAFLHITSLRTNRPESFANGNLFTCKNRFRGRHADGNDCRKFYICIGKIQPILGTCPLNTVYSEIKRQCTKNLSHCIRNNQFRCIKEGRFSDMLRSNMYYICVKNKNDYVRFQFKCQHGYRLNKTSVTCVNIAKQESLTSSTSVDNNSNKTSDQSTIERKSKEKKQDKAADKNICEQEGKFADPVDCRRYYVCSKNSKSVFRRRTKKCDSDEVFHRQKKKCVDSDSYDCN